MTAASVTGCILAGGKSRRFGSDKALYTHNGAPLIAHVADCLKQSFSSVIVAGGDSHKYGFLGLPVYPDIMPGLGPLGGLCTAFTRTSSDCIFAVACDMPFLTNGIISLILPHAGKYDLVVPHVDGNYEPLCALYGRTCMPHIEEMILRGNLRINSFFSRIRIKEITGDDILAIGEPRRFFYNINYLEDADAAAKDGSVV